MRGWHGGRSKTVNNVLTVLNTLLRVAVEWDLIAYVPCRIRLLPTPLAQPRLHDFDEYERLVEAAKRIDARAYLAVLLGGEAGLRAGEMMALERKDLDSGRLCRLASKVKDEAATRFEASCASGHRVTIPIASSLRKSPVVSLKGLP